jgi:hypothetical protein
MPPQMPKGGPMHGRRGDDASAWRPRHGRHDGAPQEPQETGPMLAELDMDIIIDRAPEAATLQAEQYEALGAACPIGRARPAEPRQLRAC